MSKATNAEIAAMKAKFETGDVPNGTDFANLIQLVQDAIQEHEHASGGGAASGTGDAAQVAYPGDLSDLFLDWPLSPMLVDGALIENGTNANTVKVGSLTAILRKTTDADGVLVEVTKAAEDNIELIAADTVHNVVLQYSGGAPAIVLQAAEPNGTTDIVIGKCIRDSGGTRHIINSGMRLASGLAKLHSRAGELRELELKSGCAILHTGTRNFTIGSGIVYGGINRFTPFSSGDFASLTDKFTLVYNNGSWQYVADQMAIPNDQYNNYGVGLANLGSDEYGCWWLYVFPDCEEVYAVYGTGTYALSESVLEQPPSNLPALIANFGALIGCVVVKEGAANFALIQVMTTRFISGAAAGDHGSLGGLADDDHSQYFKVDGTRKATGDFDMDGHRIVGISSVVGVEWNQATDTWVRIDKNGDEILLNRSRFDDLLPWAGMRRVNLAVDGTINAIHGEADYEEDGTNGRVMVQIPKFWVKSEETVANKYRWWISDHAVSGFEVHPAFNQRATSPPADYLYVSAYEADGYDDGGTFKAHSRSGVQPMTGGVSYTDMPNAGHLDIDEARTYCTNIGSYWGMMNIWSLSAIQLLFMVEYGNLDSQTAIGRGIVDKAAGVGFAGELTAAASINSNLGGNGTGAGTGTDGVVPIAYRWIENPWGNVWKFIDGYEAVDAAYHILKATGGWTNSGPSIWGAGDYDASTATPITADGWISNIEYESVLKYLLIPAAVGGSSSAYIPDYFYAHGATETNILLAGGGWFSGSSAGLGCLASNCVASSSGRNVGTRLEFVG